MTSYCSGDVEQKYCGYCHVFHDDPSLETERLRLIDRRDRIRRMKRTQRVLKWIAWALFVAVCFRLSPWLGGMVLVILAGAWWNRSRPAKREEKIWWED